MPSPSGPSQRIRLVRSLTSMSRHQPNSDMLIRIPVATANAQYGH
jgi:hypothetical protein